MKYTYIIISLMAAWMFGACSDMNDVHDPYMKDGEKIYIGRVDSMHNFGGNERVLLRYWITDPRAKTLCIYWNHKKDSINVDIPSHDPLDSQEVMIGENGSTIAEGDYTFQIYSYDNRGHRSIQFEQLVNVYGEKYRLTLSNRTIQKVSKEENTLTIEWNGSNNSEETGIEIFYTDTNDKEKSLFIETESLSFPTIIENVNLQQPVKYQTWYKPEPESIDQFNTQLVDI